MTLHAILFDLDNTLLVNDMNQFLPAYLKLLSGYAAGRYEPRSLIQHLLAATEVMAANTDPAVTNEQAFWGRFSELTGFDHAEMTPFFTRFYETRFNELQALTATRPEARPLVEWAMAQGYRTAVATNPMFPEIAVRRRLVWAGLDDLPFDLVTHYENMHAAKPHQGYYREIAAMLGVAPAEALMAGDDWELDIAPAAAVGMQTYWITPDGVAPPDEQLPLAGRGSLADLRRWLES